MELLEREHQLGELARHLEEVRGGAGRMAFVSGEAGAGKSTLAEEFARRAGGIRVLWGHSDALQTSRVLGPVHEVYAASLPAPRSGRDTAPGREALFAALFERLSPPNPHSVVILEDLHWADEATLDFLRFLGRRIRRTRCLLIGTYRDDELGPAHVLRAALGDLAGAHSVRIDLPPLSLAAVESLAEGTGRDARRIFAVTAGNPFFVREVLSVPEHAVPVTVRDAVLARLMPCSAPARELAELVSLVPGRAEPWIGALLGEVGTAADEAVERGLLRYHDAALAYRHELGRLAVEGTVARARAQELHQRILARLIEHEADVSQLVHHASRAGDVDAILKYCPLAARQAAQAGARREAAAHLATALRCADLLPAVERARLFEAHANECDSINQLEACIDSAGQALGLWRELGDAEAQSRMLLLLSRQHWKAGCKEHADRHVDAAVDLLAPLGRSRALAMAYSHRAQLAMAGDRLAEAVDFGRRAIGMAEEFGDAAVRSHALTNVGSALLSAGEEAGMAHLQEALALALAHGLPAHAGRAYCNIACVAVRQRRDALARRYVAEGSEYCEANELHDSLFYVRAYGAHRDLNAGVWDRAARSAAELIARPLPIAQRVPALNVLALVRGRRGDPGVDALLDEALRLALSTGEFQRIGPIAAARAEIAWYRGDAARVAEEAAVGLRAAEHGRDRWVASELHFWAHRAEPRRERSGPLAEPYALMVCGDWQGAAAAWQRLEAPYERALALSQGPEEALRESLAILEPLGAGPLTAIVRQRLRELGVRGIPRGPRASTRCNPAGLTAREVQVLGLLVRGHTNAELARCLHISAKTIDHHVSSILGKLEVGSRTEAVAAAFGLGVLQQPERGARRNTVPVR